MIDKGGKMVSKTVPAAVLKLDTMPKMSKPGTIISAPDCPRAPPRNPATHPKITVNND